MDSQDSISDSSAEPSPPDGPALEKTLPPPLPTPERVEFPCSECGADMKWDPAADALACEYCGNRVDVPREDRTIVERSLEDAGSAIRGFGIEVLVARCTNCGARVSYERTSTSESCVYCGSPNVLPQEVNRNTIRPESLVPLEASREVVHKNVKDWMKGLWLRPSALKKTDRFEAMGIYVPFWTFDCRVYSDWSADAGYYYYVTQSYTAVVNGRRVRRTRQVRKVRWVPAFGKRDDAYDDLLINASKGLPPTLLSELGGFDTSALVAYRPEFLAGWHAEEYQVDLQLGWEHAQSEIERTQRNRCGADVPGDTFRRLAVQNQIDGVRWKHVLLPVWSLQYRFKSKTYTVLVHGQSGHVVGRAPYSWVKIALLVLGILLGVLLLILVL